MTSGQKRAELRRLSKASQQNIFDMLRLACELIDDHAYVDQFGGEPQLVEQMEAEEFSHFGGVPKLGLMLRAFRANPKLATWKENKFNVQVMIDLAKPPKEKNETTRTDWKAKCAELELQNDQLNAQLSSVATLNAQIEELKAENNRLRGRIEQMERRMTREVFAA